MAAGPALSWEIVVAGLGHVLLFGIVAIAKCSAPPEPLFKPEESIQVALAGPPKNDTRMPQKAERAPPPPKASAPEAPAPPPPPNPSDMAFKTPDAPKTKGDPNADARQKLLGEMRRQQALQDLSAPVGKEDRLASNPDGSAEAGSQATAGTNDPETARWVLKVRDAVGKNWHPLRSICVANPHLDTWVAVDVDENGQVQAAPEVAKKSGMVSFDEAGRRAVEMTGSLPKPPAKYPHGLMAQVEFTAEQCLK